MSFTYRLFDTIGDVDLAGWQRVRSECGDSIFMDPRFIAAVEVGMRRSCRFWHVIVYDENRVAVACASLTAMSLDLAYVVDPTLASIMRRLPGVLSALRSLKLLLCGLPVSAGQSNLMLASPCQQVLSILNEVASELAIKTRAQAIVYKEFSERDLDRMNELLNLGYRRLATPPMHVFTSRFRDIRDYCAGLRSHYRKQVVHSLDKFRRAQVEISVLTDALQIQLVYTTEVHNLYDQVVDKSDMKFERLTVEFFHQLVTRLEGQVELVVFSESKKIIAFGWCLESDSIYYMLYMGLDYERNAELDLYFNLMYCVLDRALRKRKAKIHVGQAASAFKARLGCHPEPLHMFIKGFGPLLPLVIRYGSHLLVADEPAIPSFDVFRRDAPKISQLASHVQLLGRTNV
jgi:predicted N-acyltransferase